MGYLVIGLTTIFLALIGKSILGYPLVLPFMLAFSFHFPSQIGLSMAFFSGIFLSILHGSIMGRESVGLLLATGLLYLYSRRFSRRHLAYTALFSGIGSVIYLLLTGRKFSIIRVGLDVVLVFLLLPIIKILREKYFSERVVLKL